MVLLKETIQMGCVDRTPRRTHIFLTLVSLPWCSAPVSQLLELDSVRKETHVVSVMIPYLETEARLRDKKDNRPLPDQMQRHRLTERHPQKV